jgi:preprotein translocase subunit SecA
MPLADDKVWFDNERKLSGILSDIHSEIEAGNNVLVLSHFPVALTKLIRRLTDANIQHRSYTAYDVAQLCEAAPGTVWVGSARAFQAPSTLHTFGPNKAALKVLILEHHPRRSKDQALLEFAEQLACDPEVRFYFSLDDPLLLHFNNSIQSLFRKMGIDEAECLSHSLITKAIANAQENIESRVTQDLQSESIEDWFRYNLKPII